MKFTKSESSSGQPRGNQHLSRKRTLRRGCHYEPLTEDHHRYLWAAYRLGDLDELKPEPDLDPLKFKIWLLQATSDIREADGELFMLFAKEHPVGFAIVAVTYPSGAKRQLIPHVVWFRHATKRNRLECWLKLLCDIKSEGNVLIITAEPNWRFFYHLCKYGCIRAMGKFRGYGDAGQDAMMFQGVN